MDNNIIVTGGAGYIGSHVCKKLAKDGYNPITIDNLSRGDKSLVKWGPLYEDDIRNYQSIMKIIDKYLPIGVIHLAAFSYVDESLRNPFMYYDNNVNGGIALIRAMIESGVNNLVYSSSCSVYGIPDEIPIKEDCVLEPINPYGKTKQIIEQFLKDLSKGGNINHISLRYFNVAGADPDLEIGEMHNPVTRIIPLAIKASTHNSIPLKINGVNYPTHDGTCIRDYIHPSDLAKAHVRALEKLLSKDKIQTMNINLGTGNGYSVFEIIREIEKITGKKVKYIIGDRRKGDPPKLIADTSLSKKYLCWFPEISDLESIISTALEWSLLHD